MRKVIALIISVLLVGLVAGEYVWTQVNTDGFGDAENFISYSMIIYNGTLYAGTGNTLTATEIWKYDGTTWTQVNTDGFGDVNNWGSWSMAVYNGTLYAGTDNHITGTEIWKYDGTTWTQVNTDGFGDVNNQGSFSMAVYSGNLYVGTSNLNTGTEVWKITQIQVTSPTTRSVDTNKPMRSLASYRISQAQNLLEEAQKTCTELRDENDELYSTCCANRLDDVVSYLEMAEKFFMGGNYIAANYWALEALKLLQEIQECCTQ